MNNSCTRFRISSRKIHFRYFGAHTKRIFPPRPSGRGISNAALVKFITDGKRAAIFFCDRCGKMLDQREDPGEVLLDTKALLENLGTDREKDYSPEFLCRECMNRLEASDSR